MAKPLRYARAMHGENISTLHRVRFLSLLERASTLMIELDADGLNDSVGAMAEAIDGLGNHPCARENDFVLIDTYPLNCLKTTNQEIH